VLLYKISPNYTTLVYYRFFQKVFQGQH